MQVREEPDQDGRLPHSPCTRSRMARKHAEDGDQEPHVPETPGRAGPAELGRGLSRGRWLLHGLVEEGQEEGMGGAPVSDVCFPGSRPWSSI